MPASRRPPGTGEGGLYGDENESSLHNLQESGRQAFDRIIELISQLQEERIPAKFTGGSKSKTMYAGISEARAQAIVSELLGYITTFNNAVKLRPQILESAEGIGEVKAKIAGIQVSFFLEKDKTGLKLTADMPEILDELDLKRATMIGAGSKLEDEYKQAEPEKEKGILYTYILEDLRKLDGAVLTKAEAFDRIGFLNVKVNRYNSLCGPRKSGDRISPSGEDDIFVVLSVANEKLTINLQTFKTSKHVLLLGSPFLLWNEIWTGRGL